MCRIKGCQFFSTHFSHFHFELFFEKSQCRSKLLDVVRRDVLCVCVNFLRWLGFLYADVGCRPHTAHFHNRLVCRHDIDHVCNDEQNRIIIVVSAKHEIAP
jgi:hypothetical protein